MTVAEYKKEEEMARKKLMKLKLSKEEITRIAAKLNYGRASVKNYLDGSGTNLFTALQILDELSN
jgi:hypothetical protein